MASYLEGLLQNFVVAPYDAHVARCYARIVARRRQMGRPITVNDAWIASFAVRHGMPLVTHNARDFEGVEGLEIITEGEG